MRPDEGDSGLVVDGVENPGKVFLGPRKLAADFPSKNPYHRPDLWRIGKGASVATPNTLPLNAHLPSPKAREVVEWRDKLN